MENHTSGLEAPSREEKKAAQAAFDRSQAKKQKLAGLGRMLGLVLVVIAVIGGLIWLAEGQDNDQPSPISSEVSSQDHRRGNPEASVVVVEYADFQCPACAVYASVSDKLFTEYGDRVQFVFRHFPLKTIHKNAVGAARAAEAAALQGKFWEMHDVLFANQNSWANLNNPADAFVSFAEALELDTEKFRNDLNSKEVKDRVEADYDSATAAGLSGTPSFFINGQPIENPRGYEAFAELLDSTLGD